MMQQSGISASHSHMDSLSTAQQCKANFYEFTDRDRITRLQYSTKKGLCKIGAKKALLKRVLSLKNELLLLAKDDTIDCHQYLNSIFSDSIESQHQIHNHNNTNLSSVVVSLFDLFTVLHERQHNNQCHTRRGASKPTEAEQLLSELIQLSKNVDAQISNILRDYGEKDPILKGITLAPQQKSLLFNVHIIPQDAAHQQCAFCNHSSMNTVKENAGRGVPIGNQFSCVMLL